MKELSMDQFGILIFAVWICSTVLIRQTVESSCVTPETELWAYSNPATEHFSDSYKKYLTSDKGESCRWVITASDKEEVVKLNFPLFMLKNSTSSKKGDCLYIYDGKTTKASLLDKLCDKRPRDFVSSGREMLVVYSRGEVEGDRKFSMAFSSKSVLSKEKIIRIAGIVGAVLAAIGLTYVIFRATKCCSCLRGKDGNRSTRNTDHGSARERDRLTNVASGDGDNTQNNSNQQNPTVTMVTPSGNNTGLSAPSHNQNGSTSNDATHESDTDSLQDMNEPPPSYESLYLNEQGEAVTPPQYSPPPHRSKHPPRRVHTFN